MTQDEKQLLLKDICARLPYGLIVKETFQGAQRDVSVWDCGPHYIKDHPEQVKPYLRPMSSMTEEEKETYQMFFNEDGLLNASLDTYLDWLLEGHFDFRGLISKGLALEAPEGMYD